MNLSGKKRRAGKLVWVLVVVSMAGNAVQYMQTTGLGEVVLKQRDFIVKLANAVNKNAENGMAAERELEQCQKHGPGHGI